MPKNRLADIELEVARDYAKRDKKKKKGRTARRNGRKAAVELGIENTSIGEQLKQGRRKPPPVPKNKTISEIRDMDAHDVGFRDPNGVGKPRKWHNLDHTIKTEPANWKDVIRADRQRKANDRRARARKDEAKIVAAVQVLEKHVSRKQTKEMDIHDEDLAVAEGILDLDEWDNEELIRGYRRNRNGKFGAAPKFIPREIQQEAFRRLVNRGERRMKEAYSTAIEDLIDIAHSSTSDKVRLEAIKELMNRVVGKVPDKQLIAVEQPWEGVLADSMVPMSEAVPLELTPDDDGVYAIEPTVIDEAGGRGLTESRSGGDESAPSPAPRRKKKVTDEPQVEDED